MNSRQLWFWAVTAVTLFLVILLLEGQKVPKARRAELLSGSVRSADVTAVIYRPPGQGQAEIRVDRTQDGWMMRTPIVYPAQSVSIDKLLAELVSIKPATVIGAEEVKQGSEAFGFNSAQSASLMLVRGEARTHMLFGSRTAPGDQVFVQVVGREEAFVLDGQILEYLPKSAADWRSTRLMNLAGADFDRVTVTNGTRIFELHRTGEPSLWRMVRPFEARANQTRIQEALEQLQALSVQSFVSDNAETGGLERYGLDPGDLSLVFGRGSNEVLQLRFGKSPTNDQDLVFACQAGTPTVTTVARDILTPWRSAVADFRDPFLFSSSQRIDQVEVRGPDMFTLQRTPTNGWRVLPLEIPADPDWMTELLTGLTTLQITQFVKDVVTESDLPAYGLMPPALQVALRSGMTNATAASNQLLVEIQFGPSTNQADRVFARRLDEGGVYAIPAASYQALPTNGWCLRDRRLWSLTEEDIAAVTIRQQGRTRTITRKGPHDWALAAGSQGVINDLAIEETVKGLLKARVVGWVAFEKVDRAHFGFDANPYQITFEPKKGEPFSIEFGKEANAGAPYALVTLEGRAWVAEFSWMVFRDVVNYLSVPASP